MGRMRSSFSYWTDEVSAETLAQNCLKSSGSRSFQSTVRLGSGCRPRLYSVWRKRYDVLLTSGSPVASEPASESVAQVGSPEKSELYSGVRRCLTMRSLRTNWSMSSCASASVILPALRSASMYASKNRSSRGSDVAAPSFALTVAKYGKYVHWTASFAEVAGLEMSNPYDWAICFISSSALIWSASSSRSRMTSTVMTDLLVRCWSFCLRAMSSSTPKSATRR
mmetsp:Transcript_20379/g.81486  ORF Transcript_20379/g.81486 Transcript_20379/m.81486 type:complete len:224 (+) Transcript_20379:1400-2071(+)